MHAPNHLLNPVGRRLGDIVVDQRWVSREQLDLALAGQAAANRRLGEILVRLGFLSELELDFILAQQSGATITGGSEQVRQRLGEILRRAGRLSGNELARAIGEQRRTNEQLGTVLVRLGLLSPPELEAVLAWQADFRQGDPLAVRLLLGEILVATRRLSRRQLEEALASQRLSRKQIGQILVESGHVTRRDLSQALKIQGRMVALTLVALMGASTLAGCGAPRVPSQPSFGKNLAYERFKNQQLTNIIPSYDVTRNRFKLANLPGGRELQSFADGSRVLKDVPFFQQGRDNTCGQAVMAVLLNYWETKVPYQTVVDDANRFNLPTTHEGLTSYMQRQGLKARAYRQGNVDFLKERVDEGRPPIVLLEFNNDLFQQHYVVVIGYNEAKGTIIFHDSIDGPYRQLDEDTFFAMWQAENLVKLPLFGGANYQGLVIDVERSARR